MTAPRARVPEAPVIDIMTAFDAVPRQEGTNITPVACVEVDAAPVRVVCDDEIDRMEAAVKPGARFADYRPDWQVELRTFDFRYRGGTRTRTYTVIRDGNKVVALMRGGDIQLIARTPDTASTQLNMPTERYHLDNMLGPMLPTWGFVKKVDTHGSIYREHGDKALVRRRWERSAGHLAYVLTQDLPDRKVDIRFVLTVDPVYGYRIDAVYDISFAEAPDDPKARLPAGTFTPGCYVPWAYQAWYDRTVYTPEGGGLKGWANNLVCMDRCDADRKRFNWRDGGFIAYLPGPDGWSPCYTRQDGGGTTRKLSVCNAHNDFHITIPMPRLEAGADGRYRLKYVHRLLSLPPEMTRKAWHDVDLICRGGRTLVIKLGETEDFERQPVPLTEAARGLVWTARYPALVTNEAHSGTQSIRLTGRAWPNLPQVSLLPGVRYRLEGWYKIDPWEPERVADARKKLAAADAGRRAGLEKKGRPLPPPVDWDTLKPGAFIGGDYYEWSPYSNPMLEFLRTTRATADREGWQHVVLDFTAPDWAPFINIYFQAEMCDAWLDDFALRVIGLPDPPSAGR